MTVNLTDTPCSKQAHGQEFWVEGLGQACPLCERPRCRAKAKTRPGERCRQHPVPGGKTCRFHGSGTAKAKAAAAAAVQEAAAEGVVRKLIWNADAPPVTNAVAGLQLLAGQLQHAAGVLGDQLDAADLEPVTATAWLRVLRELRTALSDMERLGIAGKAVEVEAGKVRLLAVAMGRMFEVLGLDPVVQAEASRVFFEALRAEAGVGELEGPGAVPA